MLSCALSSRRTAAALQRSAVPRRLCEPVALRCPRISTGMPSLKKKVHATAFTPTAVPAGTAAVPEAAGPFRLGGGSFDVEAPLALSAAAAYRLAKRNASDDANKGHTWLSHPCPYHPFRTHADEDGWYVPPNQQERQLAQDLGLPLWGILW